MIYFMARRSMKFTELMDCLPEGFKQDGPRHPDPLHGLDHQRRDPRRPGRPEFVADLVEQLGPGLHNFLPAVVFIIACFLGFATGTSWGTFGILLPIVLEIFTPGGFDNLTAETLNEVPILMVGIGATLGGAVMGDHCSPISDTTIMASAGAQCDHVNHVSTQLPYAIVCAAIAFVSYVVAGLLVHFGAPGILALPFGLVLLLGFLVVMKRMGDDVTK